MKRFLLLLFLGCCSFLGGLAAVQLGRAVPARLAQPAGAVAADPDRLEERFEAVARKVGPASSPSRPSRRPCKEGKAKTVEESGSGVLIRPDGQRGVFVLTNNHVIAQAAPRQITVSLADDRIFKPAQVWADPESDVALLRLEGGDNLPTAALGDSDGVRVGQWVLAIGSPFGLNQTVTHGIISARERGQISLGTTIRIKDFLQTDAAINPGSSGGPLVNLDGEVIGVNTAIASNTGSNSGVAFSIPINLVKRVVKQLLEKGSVMRGYLGVQTAYVVRGGRRGQARPGPGAGGVGGNGLPGHAGGGGGAAAQRRGPGSGRHGHPQREPPHQPDQRPAGGPAHPAPGLARPEGPHPRCGGRRLGAGPGAAARASVEANGRREPAGVV